jgi:hypothetical protein
VSAPMVHERVSYAVAGRAQRQANLRAKAAQPKLYGIDKDVLAAVLDFTTSYSRLTDYRSPAEVAQAAGTEERQARRSLRKLSNGGIIVYVPGLGRGNVSVIGVPPEGVKADKYVSALGLSLPKTASKKKRTPTATKKRTREVTEKRTHAVKKKGTNARARQWTEKKSNEKENNDDYVVVADDDAQPVVEVFDEDGEPLAVEEEFVRLVSRFGQHSASQRERWRQAYAESGEGFARIVEDALAGRRPAALLDVLVQNGQHRNGNRSTRGLSPEEIAAMDPREL